MQIYLPDRARISERIAQIWMDSAAAGVARPVAPHGAGPAVARRGRAAGPPSSGTGIRGLSALDVARERLGNALAAVEIRRLDHLIGADGVCEPLAERGLP